MYLEATEGHWTKFRSCKFIQLKKTALNGEQLLMDPPHAFASHLVKVRN